MKANSPQRLLGLRVAIAWLTVAPLPSPRVDFNRDTGRAAIAATPVVGAALGGVVAGLSFLLSHTGLPPIAVGAIAVAALALLTRGMHLDGLADTADALGCYGDREKIRAILKGGTIGPFGVATLCLSLLLQAACVGSLAAHHHWATLGFAVFASRIAVVIACRVGLQPLATTGFGALVVGTQRRTVVAAWLVIFAAAAVGASLADGRTYQLAVAALWVCAVAVGVLWHCQRRFGGVNGDVLGAAIELSLTGAVILALW